MLALGLVGCGGSSGGAGGQTPTDTDSGDTPSDEKTSDDLIDDGETNNVSFLPLMTYELYSEWSGMDNNSLVYQIENPFINHFMITPVNATTLEPIDNASISDYSISEDGIPLNPKANFQMLQKVLGNQVWLDTAIVVNTSAAMSSVDKAAFIAEIKDFVSKTRNSTDTTIATQRFTVWGFDGGQKEGDGGIQRETVGFANNVADANTALSTVLTKWQDGSYQVAGSNHAYDAVIEAIGRFVGNGPFGVEEDLRDPLEFDNNYELYDDLTDRFTSDAIIVSNVVLFSAGYSDTNRFDGDTMIKALNAQSLSKYDTDSAPSGATTATKDLGKALIYVVPPGESKDDVIEGVATATIDATYSNGEYSFADDIIAQQIDAITARINRNNQYLVRYASSVRAGTGHTGELKTRTSDESYGYTISWKIDRDDVPDELLNMPTPEVEITGANNEYLSADTAYLSEINTFYPATRWTNTQYASDDYEWNSTLTFTTNTDGSITIPVNAGSGQLTLKNTKIDSEMTIQIK